MFRSTPLSLGSGAAFCATAIALYKLPPKATLIHCSAPKYTAEISHGPTSKYAIYDPKNRREFVSRRLSKNHSLGRKFGRVSNLTEAKDIYQKWFNATYGVDLSSDESSVVGCPSLSNGSALSLEASNNLDKAHVEHVKENYPAEELDEEIRRVSYNRKLGVAQ